MAREDRVFVKDGRKHYRPRYSLTEVRIGALILLGLVGVAGWVAYRGAHPEPELDKAVLPEARRSITDADRGPLPEGLAPDGWKEGRVSVFDASNLYEKIDGREGYYKALGFQKLWFVALTQGDARSIDLEVYDLGTSDNALGAAAGELPEGSSPTTNDRGLELLDRNALFMTRGQLYFRASGSDESEATRAGLRGLAAKLGALPGEALPWSYALFLGLGIGPGKVSYQKEGAFSLAAAKDVFVGLLADGETEVFVSLQADEAAARATVKAYTDGLLQYGRMLPKESGVAWIEDRYLARVTAVIPVGRFVAGVKGAADPKVGLERLGALQKAIEALPEDRLLEKQAPDTEEVGGHE